MFAKSATPATPVSRPKSHINESVVWVNGWFKPQIQTSDTVLKLKGWKKKSSSEREEVVSISNELIDLESAQYYHEPVVTELEKPEVKQSGAENAELKLALSIDKKDDQISSLSGLGI